MTARTKSRKRARGARKKPRKGSPGGRLRRLVRGAVLGSVMAVSTYVGFCTFCLLVFNVVTPPTTGVQIQRRVESWFEDAPYAKHYRPVPRPALSVHLRHAVVAAEDGRFYEHGGIDWEAVQDALEDYDRRGRLRGGSTITQQLVKNLFLTTHRSFVRKAFEVPFAYLAELLLSKERILDLYLNVIEWDRGVYGAEAAAQAYYGVSAAKLSRAQAAGLAAVIPAPRRRTPQRVGWYRDIILRRMGQMGW